VKERGIWYSKFIDIITKKEIGVDRKIMADMIVNSPESFDRFFKEVVGEIK
jgi:ribosomal protein L20